MKGSAWISVNATKRAAALLIGLALYGFSMGLMVRAGLGLDPWDVFHQGLSRYTGWTIGTASAVVGCRGAAGLDPAAQPARYRHHRQRHRHRDHRGCDVGGASGAQRHAGADRDDAVCGGAQRVRDGPLYRCRDWGLAPAMA